MKKKSIAVVVMVLTFALLVSCNTKTSSISREIKSLQLEPASTTKSGPTMSPTTTPTTTPAPSKMPDSTPSVLEKFDNMKDSYLEKWREAVDYDIDLQSLSRLQIASSNSNSPFSSMHYGMTSICDGENTYNSKDSFNSIIGNEVFLEYEDDTRKSLFNISEYGYVYLSTDDDVDSLYLNSEYGFRYIDSNWVKFTFIGWICHSAEIEIKDFGLSECGCFLPTTYKVLDIIEVPQITRSNIVYEKVELSLTRSDLQKMSSQIDAGWTTAQIVIDFIVNNSCGVPFQNCSQVINEFRLGFVKDALIYGHI